MHLVEREDRRRRIVDRRRERLQRDVDQDPEREHRILLERPLRPERDRRPQRAVVDGAAAPPYSANSGSSRGDEVADLRHELDDAVGIARASATSVVEVDGEHDLGRAACAGRSRRGAPSARGDAGDSASVVAPSSG